METRAAVPSRGLLLQQRLPGATDSRETLHGSVFRETEAIPLAHFDYLLVSGPGDLEGDAAQFRWVAFEPLVAPAGVVAVERVLVV